MHRKLSIEMPGSKQKLSRRLATLIHKTFGLLELIIILTIWIALFSSRELLGDFTRQEMITYIIFGNLTGLVVGYLLQGVLRSTINRESSELLLKNPIRFLLMIFFHSFGRNFLGFLFLGIVNLFVLYFFLDNFIINSDRRYLVVIAVMMFLAFVSDFLVIYLVRMFTFWSFENHDSQIVLSRLKKFISGNYFPLSLLPIGILNVCYILPFAYSFFVPAELYLKKIDIELGVQGIGVQMVWIVIIYYVIKLVSYQQNKVKKLKTKDLAIDAEANSKS